MSIRKRVEWYSHIAAMMWSIWCERNARIFQSSIAYSLQVLAKINHFASFWLGTLAHWQRAALSGCNIARRLELDEEEPLLLEIWMELFQILEQVWGLLLWIGT